MSGARDHAPGIPDVTRVVRRRRWRRWRTPRHSADPRRRRAAGELAGAAPRKRLAGERVCAARSARFETPERTRFARDLDHELRDLCHAEASARRTLGLIGRELLKHGRFQRLGFVRIHDYAIERLGVSGRTLETAALVAARLEALPHIAAAFERGELSWTHVRLLCSVATAESDAAWLRLARGRRTEDLAEMVAATRGTTDPGPRIDASDDLIDGEEAVRVRIACPSRLRALWRYALELASRVAGSRLPTWRAVELIAAEGIAGRPPEAIIGDRLMRAWMRAWRAHRHQSPDDHPPSDTSTRAAGADDGVDHTTDAATAEQPTTQRRLLVTAATGDTDCNDPFALDARLRATIQLVRRIEPRVGALLRTFVDVRGYRSLGFRSTNAYVRERLGISVRKAWALIAIDRQAGRAPEYGDAYAAGTLSWSRALALLPVVDRRNTAEWVAHANAVTVRELVATVNHALDLRDTLGVDASPELAAHSAFGSDHRVQIGAGETVRARWPQNVTASVPEVFDAEIAFTGPATVVALFREALDVHRPAGAALATALERLLRTVVADWEAEPKHDDPVFARDGWHCAVPACSGRRELHDHHLRFRSKGGSNDLANRIAICAGHHLRGIHRGVIRAEGTAPLDVRWQLGVRHGKPPLLTFVGDRYVVGSSADSLP